MNQIDKNRLFKDLIKDFLQKRKKSKKFYQKADLYLVQGGSHNLRLGKPFPFYDRHARGALVTDLDGNKYIDFWQGHFANILGHNPLFITEALKEYFGSGQGLVTGFPGQLQKDLAKLILESLNAEKIRFTTSGTLASMYSIMLSKSFTKRELVMKVGGGWHGAQPYALKGISIYSDGLKHLESAGLPQNSGSSIIMTKFNDEKDLEAKFLKHGDEIACLILEPFIGAGGFIFADRNYLEKTRQLTDQYGAVLIFDEVISGFRFAPSALQNIYSIKPDLSVLGKTIGGGMPVSAVAGREDIMLLCSLSTPLESRVKFEGGTFSAHPASMLAGTLYLQYLQNNADKIYSRIGHMGNTARQEIEKIFQTRGFNVKCSGLDQEIVKQSSLVGVHFLNEGVDRIISPEQVWNSNICDVEMRENIFRLAMLNEGYNIFHGYGSISFAHTEKDIRSSLEAVERVAERFKKYRY